MALLALLLIAPAPSIGALIAFHLAPGTAFGAAAYAMGKIWLYAFPIVWLLLVERGRLCLSPMRSGEIVRGLAVGGVLGFLIAALVIGVFLLYVEPRLDASPLRQAMIDNGLDQPWRYIAACAWLATVNALLEEYVFRWFIFEKCMAILPALAAILTAAAIFTVHHVIVLRDFFDWPLAMLTSAGVFLGGAIWCWCYQRFASIWPGYLSHAIVDMAIFIVGWRIMFQ
jgi:membrane protease YdiL (CAAX protease family)